VPNGKAARTPGTAHGLLCSSWPGCRSGKGKGGEGVRSETQSDRSPLPRPAQPLLFTLAHKILFFCLAQEKKLRKLIFQSSKVSRIQDTTSMFSHPLLQSHTATSIKGSFACGSIRDGGSNCADRATRPMKGRHQAGSGCQFLASEYWCRTHWGFDGKSRLSSRNFRRFLSHPFPVLSATQ
jgi:hypothetical protein